MEKKYATVTELLKRYKQCLIKAPITDWWLIVVTGISNIFDYKILLIFDILQL